MAVIFHKLHSSGNDFIVLLEWENDELSFLENREFIFSICHRHYGVGGDGVFFVYGNGKVVHYDSDGSESFCINGSLCLAGLKQKYPAIPDKFVLNGVEVFIDNCDNPSVRFKPFSPKVKKVKAEGVDGVFVEIGNPHFFIENKEKDINLARKVRYAKEFEKGVNVSFVKKIRENVFEIATYERGVENFTLACGSACAAFVFGTGLNSVEFVPLSGIPIKVNYNTDTGFFTVEGSVSYVAQGSFFN